jgi:hypothetical protein
VSDYTPEEQKAYDEGRAAQESGADFFSSPYMQPPRNLPLLCAWSTGFVEAEEIECGKCEGSHSPLLPCVAMSAAAEDRRALNI